MPRDFKHIGGKGAGKPGAGTTGFLAFLSGLSIGLLAAFIVFLYYYRAGIGTTPELAPLSRAVEPESSAETAAETDIEMALPRPTFDFYKILPNREVNLSEWVAEEQSTDSVPEGQQSGGLYILQVGSFKTFEAADQIKARLALLGIAADIQRVVINGQDIRHRVRIGPYHSPEKFEEIRKQLLANDMDFMVLKLKIEEGQAAGG